MTHPATLNAPMLHEIAAGLSRAQKELPPKYFYDRRGSELFEEITRLPEYYLTRAERALLVRWSPAIAAETGARTLVELGAGSAEKTRILLDALRAGGTAGKGSAADARAAGALAVYAPVDVSAAFLEESAARLRAEYPGMRVAPVVADISEGLALPRELPRPALFAFLGSTIGNFAPPDATRLLARVRAVMRDGDRFLLGADLRKDPRVIEAAYNDARGVTAEFNRNVLRVINRELRADFVPEAFDHHAFYDRALGRIEMHLVSRQPQTVRIPGHGVVEFGAGERMRTEISCKYDRAAIDEMLGGAGMRVRRWLEDERHGYALVLAEPSR